ncbi:basic amino-acid permease [Trichomonascus vanleenenianus]|uniref:amino acid permease n=1 Tax=Trichomonascus vanleenenianus TaxID=2268995 RepID=UPI003ECB922B
MYNKTNNPEVFYAIEDPSTGQSQQVPSPSKDIEKQPITGIYEQPPIDDEMYDPKDETPETRQVARQLKARHMAMISLGGTIGSGLFIGTADSLSQAGPVGALIGFLFMGSLAYSITQSLGEMTTYIPVTGSFTAFSTRFISPSFGAALGWLYWFSWALTFAVEINAAAMVLNYWTDAVPNAAWIAIFFVVITLLNLCAVKFYGEIEFWVALVKVVAVVGWIIYAFCMVCGAGKTGPVGFRYWRNPGPWGPGIYVKNVNSGRFLGWLSSLVNAAFTYQGTELVGIAAGESSNPRKNVPKAINKVFYRIVVFYICSIILMGLLVPYNDPQLESDDSYIASSPFVIAIINSGTKVLPSIFNAVILSTVLSAGNSDVYYGSRILYALAETGVAPKWFKWCNKQNVPVFGVILTAVFGLFAFLNVSNSATTVFNWLLNISAVGGMIGWCAISFCHIRFMQGLKVKGIDRNSLPFTAKWAPYSTWYAFIANFCIVFLQGFSCFFNFSADTFLTAYISLFIFVALWIIFQVVFRCPFMIKLEDMDFDSGRLEVERTVWEEKESKTLWHKMWDVLC